MAYVSYNQKGAQFNMPKMNITKAKDKQKIEHSIWTEDIDFVVLGVVIGVVVWVVVGLVVRVEVGVVVVVVAVVFGVVVDIVVGVVVEVVVGVGVVVDVVVVDVVGGSSLSHIHSVKVDTLV